eukprot:5663702-Amphidinium_carterae.2
MLWFSCSTKPVLYETALCCSRLNADIIQLTQEIETLSKGVSEIQVSLAQKRTQLSDSQSSL